MSHPDATATRDATAARAAMLRGPVRRGVEAPESEAPWAAGVSPDSPPLDAGDAGNGYEPSFQESSAGTALFDDGDLSRDDGASPLVA